jgi:TRAP-type C4-dicarboxylate transport system substrate-binding protein
VLTLANMFFDSGELDGFVREVDRLSDGTLRIEVQNSWRNGETAAEEQLIADVRAGGADLGAAASRAWDAAGVRSVRALHAPLLIDSYALQERVVQDPLAADMLDDLEPVGLAGLGVLPGPMRKPLGVTGALARPSDYRGLTVGIQRSGVAAATFRALDATPVPFPAGGAITRFGAVEQQLHSIDGNRYGTSAKYLTANVNLWPRPLILFASQAAFGALTADQRDVLRRAVAAAIPAQTASHRLSDRESAGNLCRAGEQFITPSARDMAALRRAVAPVYAELRRDPHTREMVERIEALRDPADAAPDQLSCANPATTATRPSRLDGVWRTTTTPRDHPTGMPDNGPGNYGRWIYVFDHGRFAFTQENDLACTWGYGTFIVTGDRVAWTFEDGGGHTPDRTSNKPGEYFVFGWSLYRDTLTLTPVKGEISPENFWFKPWHRSATTPTRNALSARCPPPAGALPR